MGGSDFHAMLNFDVVRDKSQLTLTFSGHCVVFRSQVSSLIYPFATLFDNNVFATGKRFSRAVAEHGRWAALLPFPNCSLRSTLCRLQAKHNYRQVGKACRCLASVMA